MTDLSFMAFIPERAQQRLAQMRMYTFTTLTNLGYVLDVTSQGFTVHYKKRFQCVIKIGAPHGIVVDGRYPAANAHLAFHVAKLISKDCPCHVLMPYAHYLLGRECKPVKVPDEPTPF